MFFYKNLTSEGFFELNNFKNLYTPFGVLNNIWASILLLFIPFNLIFLIHLDKKGDKILLILNLLLTVFSIIVSFSRGAYLSVFVFVFLLNVLLINYLRFKQLFLYNIIMVLMFSTSALLMYNSFKTTISFNKIESQQRSTDGRIALWKHSFKLIKDKPIVGYGQDNYLLAQDKHPYLGEDIANSYRTNNTYIELLIERGILGFASYLFFFLIVLIIVFKNLKSRKNTQKEKIEIAIIFSGIIAILVREFTFSSLFENDFVYLLTFHLVFLLIPYDIKIKEYRFSQRKKIGFLAISLVVFSILFVINIKRVFLVYNNYKFVEAYEKGEIGKSLKLIDKALLLSPKNIILNKHKAIALAASAYKIDISEKQPNLLFVNYLNKDTLSLSLDYLQRVLTKKPFDSETNYNLGWVNFILGNDEKAGYYFNKILVSDKHF
ncbi:O-antigen ligase family protein [Lutibacter sp.]|uniref:O-antigen ligase family protein n=1 Tax=Lutibacter sp. TaxID=1925666 RepID=UPI0025BB5238|nr:O-antigen ligase family protein [Lutibacter sp.]MCF6168935.1 O-antigen ligase family protein [Lutibacter sp.]